MPHLHSRHGYRFSRMQLISTETVVLAALLTDCKSFCISIFILSLVHAVSKHLRCCCLRATVSTFAPPYLRFRYSILFQRVYVILCFSSSSSSFSSYFFDLLLRRRRRLLLLLPSVRQMETPVSSMKVAVHRRSSRLPSSLRATGEWSGQIPFLSSS